MASPFLTIGRHVAACNLGDNTATVLLNYHTGKVHTLLDSSARWWAELATTGDPSHPTALSPTTAARLGRQLQAAGLLVNTDKPRPWPAPLKGRPWRISFGAEEHQAEMTPLPRVPNGTLVLAALAVTVALVAVHVGRKGSSIARVTALLTWAQTTRLRPATAKRAERAVYAVRRVGRIIPGRMACLEESTAAAVLLAALRRRVTWCHGVAGDPITFHAWLQTDDLPVAEPRSTGRYTIIRAIPATRLGGCD